MQPVIVLFGGTVEGRKLAEALQDRKLQLHICVATEYGASLLPKAENVHVYPGRMDAAEMEHFLRKLQPEYCLDATHPYAAEVTENIADACGHTQVPYIRVLRQGISAMVPPEKSDDRERYEESKTIFVSNVDEAVAYLSETTGKIFITTGSKELQKYTALADYQTRCVARVLPTLSVMEKCKEIGFEGKNLIGMQGPFSEELNYCMLKQENVRWLVTKNSGKAGGYPEKCEAALRLGVNLVVIGRPVERAAHTMTLEESIHFFSQKYDMDKAAFLPAEEENAENVDKRILYLVGMGPGQEALLTIEARKVLETCDVIIGAKRVLEIWKGYRCKPHFESYRKEEILEYLQTHKEYKSAAIVYSGDIGFYSGAKGMWEMSEEISDDGQWEIRAVSGISSPLYFLNKIKIPWQDVKLASCHGKQADIPALLSDNEKVCILLGGQADVSGISRQLTDRGMDQVKLTVGERLSYPDERICSGHPKDFIGRTFDTLSVLLLER